MIYYRSKIFLVFLLILILKSFNGNSQEIKYSLEAQAGFTSNSVVPFWLRSNQFGSIPSYGPGASIIGSAHKDYRVPANLDSNRTSIIDWGFGLNTRINGSKKSDITLVEAFAKLKISIFQLKVGRDLETTGLNGDRYLTSGNFAISGNALGIPKVDISIPEYTALPFLDGLISVKGQISHGWVGNVEVSQEDFTTNVFNIKHPKTYLHQKSLYGRIGKLKSKLKLYGGFSHNVFWGNEKQVFGDDYTLSNIQTLFYVMTGKAYGNNRIPTSKIGNQLGSIDVGVEYDFSNVKVLAYRQNFYEVGALAKLANIKDGLNGIAITNKNFNDESVNRFQWKKVLLEFLYTKDQAGYPTSTFTKSGDEDYYNNYYYPQGWSYKRMGLGNPFITTYEDAREGQLHGAQDFFINNRVIAFHTGFEAKYNNWSMRSKISYSLNYGTFTTSKYGKTTGRKRVSQDIGIFEKVNQFSAYLSVEKHLLKNYFIGCDVALDNGRLLNNSFGSIVNFRKEF